MRLAECVVCFETLETTTQDIYAARCGHVLHSNCWIRWLGNSSTCPTCKSPIMRTKLIKLFLTYDFNEVDTETLQNEIDSLKCELSCKAVEWEKSQEDLEKQHAENSKLRMLNQKYASTVSELQEVAKSVDLDLLGKREAELEALRKAKAHQTEELKKAKAELEKSKKDQNFKSKIEADKFRSYRAVVEGLKKCVQEYDEMKFCKQLVKKLKIYTDDIDACADVKVDVKKDPEKYVDMFQEVKKFWDWIGKKNEEVNNCPKGCVIRLSGFPQKRPNLREKNIPIKSAIQSRVEYYGAKVAYITYAPGNHEAFVRLVPGAEKNPAEMVVGKLTENKLRIKNFVVDAVALKGEEELKFLKRSLEDRDRKTGRIAAELDFSDDSNEVGQLDYFMNLIALV